MLIQRRILYVFLWLELFCMALIYFLQRVDLFLPFILSVMMAFLLFALVAQFSSCLSRVLEVCYTLFLGFQCASLLTTGYYVEVITLANLGEFTAVDESVQSKVIMVLVLGFVVPLFIYSRQKMRLSLDVLWLLVPCGLFAFFEVGPLTAFAQATVVLGKQLYFQENLVLKTQQKQLYGKDTIYVDEGNDVPDLSGKNLVIFFSEGVSLDTIDSFSPYEGLTPNIARFMEKSVWFDNYFNHTMATYRGLRGQLTSSYQYMGGVQNIGLLKNGFDTMRNTSIQKILEDTVVSLPTILKQHGYHSYFLSGRPSSCRLNDYLALLGFDKVFSANDYLKQDKSLSDQQMALYLQDLLTKGELQEPFVLGIYNVGTHYGKQSPDKTYVLNGRDDNQLLNVFHNYDDALGKIFSFIETQPELAEKTAIILTADHATYHSDMYNQTFADKRLCFMSRIPFVIYYKGIEPRKLDAGGRNSLDMAPTVLHMLRFNSGHNYFLGCSLFNQTCAYPFHYIFNAGEQFYRTSSSSKEKCVHFRDGKVMQQIRDFYHLSDNRRLR